jgi:hypothetical protein
LYKQLKTADEKNWPMSNILEVIKVYEKYKVFEKYKIKAFLRHNGH